MRNVCFIINSLTGGGAERLVITLAGEMARRGLDVHIITLYKSCNYSLVEGVTYHSLGASKSSSARRLLVRQLRLLVQSLERDVPFDLIVANLLQSSEVVIRAGIKGVYHCINNPLDDQIRYTRPWIVQGWWQAKLRRLYNNQHLIAVSQGVARNLTGSLKIKTASLSVIFNGFDFDEIRRLAEMPQHMADAMQPFVLHVGHFKRQKRLDLLLEAWAILRPEHKLVLLGKGSPRKMHRLKEQSVQLGIADSVFFAGWHENAYAWMKRADLLVLSSDFEGFGRVLVEAIGTGTPVVSTDCPYGPAEILKGEMRRWLVPKNDPVALADGIRSALQSPYEVDRSIVDAFSIDRVVDQYLNLRPRRELLRTRTFSSQHKAPASNEKKVLFVPVSSPTGAGEYYRCLSMAQGLFRRRPTWQFHICLNRNANVMQSDSFQYHLLEDSPTLDIAGVEALLKELRPDLVIFDSTLRGCNLKWARKCGATIVYISSRPGKRRKGFSLRKLRYIDHHWIITSPSGHRLSFMEKVALRLANGSTPKFFSSMIPEPDALRREAFLETDSFPSKGYVLFASGGGGGAIKNMPAAAVFQQAASLYQKETGTPAILVAGPLSRINLNTAGNRLELRSVSPEQLSDLIAGALLVVSGGGSIVNQVLALKRPCLCVPAGGRDQPLRIRQLADEELVITCAPDSHTIAQAAAKLAADEKLRSRLTENAKERCFVNGLEQALDELECYIGNYTGFFQE